MCFLGYPPGIKGYKLYDIQARQCFIFRDVVFHEFGFPFHTVTHSNQLSDPFSDFVLPYTFTDTSPDTPTPLSPITLPQSFSSTISSPLSLSLPDSQPLPLRRSSRPHQPPVYLQDCHCSLLSYTSPPLCTTKYPLSTCLSYHTFSPPINTLL